jgi:hypothetical protein
MNVTANPAPKVPLGRIVITPHAKDVLDCEDILAGIRRHEAGDWGELPPEDREANDRALIEGTRILSVYPSKGVCFWIITEADRSATTVLMPEDY